MTYNLFIDDERFPVNENEWVIARSSAEAIAILQERGAPNLISFDHDLGGDDTAMRVVRWLIEYSLDGFNVWPYQWEVHSQNPVGANNICSAMLSYERMMEKD